jgi:hypothetical protein
MICESILEADFVVEDQNTFEDNPQDTFDQGKWILPLHLCLYLKGKCALGPFLSILVIECQHKWTYVNLCKVGDKVQIK